MLLCIEPTSIIIPFMNFTTACCIIKTHSPHKFISLSGKRKIGGTLKVCSSDNVKNNIIKLIGAQVTIAVKRKFKNH